MDILNLNGDILFIDITKKNSYTLRNGQSLLLKGRYDLFSMGHGFQFPNCNQFYQKVRLLFVNS